MNSSHFEPAALGAELAAAQKVALGHDADQLAFLVDEPAGR